MYAVSVESSLEIGREEMYIDGIRWLIHGSSFLNIHLLSPFRYLDRFAAAVLLGRLLHANVVGVQYGGEVSTQ